MRGAASNATYSYLFRHDPVMQRVDYVGIETSHSLKVKSAELSGRMDLWHLLRMPVGSILIVPLNENAPANDKQPLSYGLPGRWMGKAVTSYGDTMVRLMRNSGCLRRP